MIVLDLILFLPTIILAVMEYATPLSWRV
jgi:hypothetical protein